MDAKIKSMFTLLLDEKKEIQYQAFQDILKATEQEVDWAYHVWDQLVDELTDRNAHKRSRAAQILARLAISDPDKRILDDFSALTLVTKDEKFVVARHSLQAIWRVGLAGKKQQELVVHYLAERYQNCQKEKNYTLIRFDIIQGLRSLYDQVKDEDVRQLALRLIDFEEDQKYRKKYAIVWRNA